MQINKVLITGGKGFIGSPIKAILEAKGVEAINYDLSDGNDILEVNNLEKYISECDAVIHMAAILGTDKTVMNPELGRKAINVNIIGGFNVVEICTKLGKRLVTMDNGNYWMANTYSASKHFINQIIRAYTKSRGLNADIVRAYNAYGAGQSTTQNKFAPNFILAALKNEPLKIYGDGFNIMDPVYNVDVAQVISKVLLFEDGTGKTYQAGVGIRYTVLDVAKKVIEMTNSKSEIELIPMRAGEDDFAEVYADNPYPIEYISLDAGLPIAINYYKNLNESTK